MLFEESKSQILTRADERYVEQEKSDLSSTESYIAYEFLSTE